jgi:hypothetical protein
MRRRVPTVAKHSKIITKSGIFEGGMRGGISTISKSLCAGQKPLFEAGRISTSFIKMLLIYMDGDEPIFAGVWFSISVGDEINEIDLVNLPDGSHTGYIVECGLEYPSELQQLHNDYPLAPEHVTTTEDMLSLFYKSLNLKCAFTEKSYW